MKRLIFLFYISLVPFALMLLQIQSIVRMGLPEVILVMTALYLLLFCLVFSAGTIARCLSGILLGLGCDYFFLWPICIYKQGRSFGVSLCLSPEMLYQYLTPRRVVTAYLNNDAGPLARYKKCVAIQLATKVIVASLIAVSFLQTFGYFGGFVGLVLFLMVLEFSKLEEKGFCGEYTLYHLLDDPYSDAAAEFFAQQMALYFLDDKEIADSFQRDTFSVIYRSNPDRLVDPLFYLYLAKSYSADIDITPEVEHYVTILLRQWAKLSLMATVKGWFIYLYLLMAILNGQTDRQSLIASLLEGVIKECIVPFRWAKNSLLKVMNFYITAAQTGYYVRNGEQKNKFKVVFKHLYCKISPQYRRAHRQLKARWLERVR